MNEWDGTSKKEANQHTIDRQLGSEHGCSFFVCIGEIRLVISSFQIKGKRRQTWDLDRLFSFLHDRSSCWSVDKFNLEWWFREKHRMWITRRKGKQRMKMVVPLARLLMEKEGHSRESVVSREVRLFVISPRLGRTKRISLLLCVMQMRTSCWKK